MVYGEPIRYDPTFNGPIHNRSCTDILWLIAFILYLGVWGWVGYHSISEGNIDMLLAPMDSNGKRCGMDSGLEDKKYLVFFDISRCLSPDTPITGCPTTQVCVNQCPSRTIIFPQLDETTFLELRSNMVCTYDINVQTLTYIQAQRHITNKKCASYVVQSQPVMGRCFLNVTEAMEKVTQIAQSGLEETEVLTKITELVQFQQLSAQIVQDLVQSRWYLLGALVAVVVVCFVYILLLRWVVAPVVWASIAGLLALLGFYLVQSRWCLLGALVAVVFVCFVYILLLHWVVAPVVWASIAGLLAVLGFSVYLCYKNYVYFKENPVQLVQTTNLKGYAQSVFSKHQTWLAILIAVALVLLILLIMVIFLRSRITVAIALIREGSKAVYDIKSTIFFPMFPWVLQCAVIAYGILVLMLLMSIGESAFSVVNMSADTNCICLNHYEDYVPCNPQVFTTACNHMEGGRSLGPCQNASCHFTGIDNPTSVTYLHLVNLLGFFWMMFFISGVSDMMLASTFSTWYWTFKKKDLPFFTLTSGIFRTIRFHLGTVAFGALIIAIVRVIRVILEYIDHKIKKFDNPFTRCIMCFCKCFCWCLENFLKFINKNAYIMCAVHGKSFCSSARDAFSLLMRNIIRVIVLDKVTDFIFFLSKMLISIGVGFAVYYLLQWNFVYEVTQGERLHYNYIPAIILSIATYLICTIFFNVYAMAVDTLFLCFLEDCERNDGSPEKPYFMSKNLMNILGKKNKQA